MAGSDITASPTQLVARIRIFVWFRGRPLL
jgi:hypothetical protein